MTSINEIREHHARVTPGPWQWFGNTDVNDIYLASRSFGRMFVMLFRRWGLNSAEPVFCQDRSWKPNPTSMLDFDDPGVMTPARELVRYEVAPTATHRKDQRVYRADIDGIRNTDAEFLAKSWEYVDTLLNRVEHLESELHTARAAVSQGGQEHRDGSHEMLVRSAS